MSGLSKSRGASRLAVTSMFADDRKHDLVDENATADEQALAALGYRQEFKRDFTIIEQFCLAFSVIGLLPSVSATITYSLGYSGTGGAVWGWLIACIGLQFTAFSMAELASSMPTAGGLYYAAAVLAPEGWGPVASWFVGWSNFCGYVTGPCAINYALASTVITCAQTAYPTYTPQTWHIYLVMLLVLIVEGMICTQSTRVIGYVNLAGAVWNILIVVIFIIWFPAGSINDPKTNSSEAVWLTFENVLFTMSGFDAPFHLCEECANPQYAAPRAIVLVAQLGLYIGWAIIIVIAYTVQDIGAVVTNGQPFAILAIQVLGEKAGLAMISLNIVALCFVGIGCTVTTSRIVFAYSRDGALPGSRLWRRVSNRTQTPVFATWGVLFVAALLGLLMFAGPITIGAVFSLASIAQFTAFTTPIALKLFFSHDKFKPGPWNLGRWSRPINAMAVAWLLIILPALCFPFLSLPDLTAQSMNWTIVIYGGAMLLAMLYYAVSGRHWFKGPRATVTFVESTIEKSA